MPVTVEQEPELIDFCIVKALYLFTFSLVVAVFMLELFRIIVFIVTGLYPLLLTRLSSLSCGRSPVLSSRREDVERTSQAIQQLSVIFFIVLSSSDSSPSRIFFLSSGDK